MASLNKTPLGFTVQVICEDGKRRSIALGHLTRQQAQTIRQHIEHIVLTKKSGLPLDSATQRWLNRTGDELYGRIAHAGIIKRRTTSRLDSYLEQWIKAMSPGHADTTVSAWEHVREALVEFFGADFKINHITQDEVRRWREWQLSLHADNTVRRRIGFCRQMFRKSVKERQLTENPFDGFPTTVIGWLKEYFITNEKAQAILAKCPDHHWRLYFALARYGGLRIPSEIRGLRWSDVNWEDGVIRVLSPKTKRFPNQAERKIPLFKTLEPHLLESFQQATPGDDYLLPVIFRRGWAKDGLKQIIRDAGFTVWQRLHSNLRSSRQAELLKKYLPHVVAAWMGHSEAVALRHYSQVTPDDMQEGREA